MIGPLATTARIPQPNGDHHRADADHDRCALNHEPRIARPMTTGPMTFAAVIIKNSR